MSDDITCLLCNQDFEFSLGHHCTVMSTVSRQEFQKLYPSAFVGDKVSMAAVKGYNEGRNAALEEAARQVEQCPGERVITSEYEQLWILPNIAAARIRALKKPQP